MSAKKNQVRTGKGRTPRLCMPTDTQLNAVKMAMLGPENHVPCHPSIGFLPVISFQSPSDPLSMMTPWTIVLTLPQPQSFTPVVAPEHVNWS